MFNRVIVKHWSQLEHAIGRDKIYANFLVNATTTASSVTEQALDCITRLINHDFDHKPWNKSQEFDMDITPKKNMSVSLKDEQFNRLPLTCAVTLYHFDDVASFLDKFQHVTNQLACILAPSAFLASAAASSGLAHLILPANLPANMQPPQLSYVDEALAAWSQGCQEQPPTDAAAHHQKTWDTIRVSSIADTLFTDSSDPMHRAHFLAASLAIETSGVFGRKTTEFLKELGHRLRQVSGEANSFAYLTQRLSVAIQRGNAASVLGTIKILDIEEEEFLV
ncbi:hypothetical protein EMCRGX_G021634 [Ephydatia muelleri]